MPINPGPVLIVDDDAAVRNALKFALEIEGLNVRLYEDAAELLTDANLPQDGCLVVDYQMPAMSGLELVDILRREMRSYPTILITGKISGDLWARAAKAGICTVLEKPLSDEALINTIRSTVSGCPQSHDRS
jgi:two-component system response regulator FixJ